MASSSTNKIKPGAVAIIQARMSSERLPGKAMADLAGKPLLYHVIERSKAIEGVSRVILATGASEANRPIVDLAESLGIGVFTGPEDNVLERYKLASDKYPYEYIVRVTGDNPLTDPDYASMAVEIATESGADLSSLGNLPLGAAVEIIKKSALDEAFKLSTENYHREHVTPYIKEHPELFRIERHPVSFESPFENLRLTVDTEEDYVLVKKIFEELYKGKIFSLEEVVAFLSENQSLVKINSRIKQRSMTQSSHD